MSTSATHAPAQTNRAQNKYQTKPYDLETYPPGVPYIIGNEAAERFSFYGMKTILVIFMTEYLLNSTGAKEPMTEAQAMVWNHTFVSATYGTALLGSLLADIFLGKYLTIMLLSIVYCLGHFALALDETRTGLMIGLTLIALGAGGIKPCVSAHVGDQFGKRNAHLIERIFSWFYFSINFGAFFSTLLTPWLLRSYGPSVAFGVPGVLMAIATFTFWLGRNKFVHIQPKGMGFLKEVFSKDGVGKLLPLAAVYFLFLPFFWALYDQTGSSWVLQAKRMDRVMFGQEWYPDQIQALNPLLIMGLVPLATYFIYPWWQKSRWAGTPLRKLGVGFFMIVPSFLITAWVEHLIQLGQTPSIAWHALAFLIITASEVLVSVTALEFAYTQAPNSMKSFVLSFYLFSVTIGNWITVGVNLFIQNPDGTSWMNGLQYNLFFAGLMFVAAMIFVPFAKRIRTETIVQG